MCLGLYLYHSTVLAVSGFCFRLFVGVEYEVVAVFICPHDGVFRAPLAYAAQPKSVGVPVPPLTRKKISIVLPLCLPKFNHYNIGVIRRGLQVFDFVDKKRILFIVP